MLLQFDGTLIIMAISFIIFMIIMQKIFYAPMTEIREERDNYINHNLDLAKKAREESSNLIKDYESTITQAKIKANGIVSESTSVANKEKSQVLENAIKEVNNQINTARENILNDKNNAREALKSQVVSLAHMISTKVLGEEVPISGIDQGIVDKTLNR